ncbi:MAG: PD40 domain-containing protein [Chloroflexi bacterium]|nr:PD40 domain-containing protein [Chloroflexota bacterium]
MNKRYYPVVALLTLALAVTACVLPGGGAPAPAEDQVATIVASTVQALTPAPGTESTSTPEPEAPTLLPHSLYFLGNDATGLMQVFRIGKDGGTQVQVTSEPVNVGDYAVSPIDGSVVYVVNNQLLWVAEDGSGRKLLVDGGAVDENNPFLSNITNPVVSPDGRVIAYGHKGLNFYALETGVSNRVLDNQFDDLGSGMFIPKELYLPEKYSPDGKKLLLTLAYYEGASAAVYYPDSKALVRLTGGQDALICCGEEEWTADGSAFYMANPSMGMFSSGMWRVDSSTGAVTTLLPGDAGGGMYNLPDEPFLAPDGQLYYFHAKVAAPEGFSNRNPLQLVRSAPDGVTDRTILLPDTFEAMNEALWAPDGSFVIVAFAPTLEVYFGGQAEVVYTDGSPGVVLTSFAQDMKWGP